MVIGHVGNLLASPLIGLAQSITSSLTLSGGGMGRRLTAPAEASRLRGFEAIIHGRDDSPDPAFWHPAIDLGDRALAMSIADLAALDMQQRYRWVDWFMAESATYKFTNFLGILRFFDNDPDLRDIRGWSSIADAGVLQAFQDGYRLYQGQEAIGYQLTEPIRQLDAGAGWKTFFQLFHEGGSPAAAEQQWGFAEQAGVNYGCTIALPLYRQAPRLQRHKIYRLVLWSDIYRGMKCRGWDQRWWGQRTFAPVMSADNWASEEFVRLIGEQIITGGHEVYRHHDPAARFDLIRALFAVELRLLEGLHARVAYQSEVIKLYRPYAT